MLARLDPRRLDRLWFPLGGRTKEETRARAREAGLAAARPESQEACFLAGGDYRAFLERHGLARAGADRGRVGARARTPRRLLALHAGPAPRPRGRAGEPVYALETRPRTNTVVVGPRESLARTTVDVAPGRLFVPVERVEAKLRYRSPAAPARVEPAGRAFGSRSTDPPSASRPARRRSSTRTTWSSAPA